MTSESKRRIAYITPFNTGNIGTALQAYATQVLLDEAGYPNDLIDYVWKPIQNPFRIENLIRRGPVTYLSAIVGYLSRLPRMRAYHRFLTRIRKTRRLKKSELPQLNREYDFFIAGSDCIWNAEQFGIESAYFLDFVADDARKGNYASSFAMNRIPDAYRAQYEAYLRAFPMLSAREDSGRAFIRELTGREATLVLDPTLTLPAAFWSGIAKESRVRCEKPYLFVAEYARSRQMWEDAETLAKANGWQIVSPFPAKGKRARARVILDASPQDYLYLIEHAEFVLTDSYHMTIFAINFARPFLTYIANIAASTVSKYESILRVLGIEGRISYVNSGKCAPLDVCALPPLDYDAIHARLATERSNSRDYILRMLKENLAAGIER